MDHFAKLKKYEEQGQIPSHLALIIHNFFLSYAKAIEENGFHIRDLQPILDTFIELVAKQLEHPYQFEPYHQRLVSPIDYYHFGIELLRPLVVFNSSKVHGLENADRITSTLAKGENVILFANHQTEPDPQAISLLLENTHPHLAEEMIFVAGHRVTSDPLAVPFSLGRNLLCIHSKRHLENHPELKAEKQLQNQRTIKKMAQLLDEGGKCIYVAPSGGRDRLNASGAIEVAPFDPQSIELFWLMSQQASPRTHFYPLALSTYNLLPPPSSIEKQLGEQRHTISTPIHLAFCPEIEMENILGNEAADKKLRRQFRADYIWQQVVNSYQKLISQ